jgi:hypothetical protein
MPHETATLREPTIRAAITSTSVSPIHTSGARPLGVTDTTLEAFPCGPIAGGEKARVLKRSNIPKVWSCFLAVVGLCRIEERIR